MLVYNNITGNEFSELQNVRMHNVGSLTTPSNTANKGLVRLLTTTNTLNFWNGTAWLELLTGPITGASITLASGQLFVGNGSNLATATAKTAIPLSGFGAAGADVSMGGFKLTNVAAPVASTDAATKGYVDGIAQSLNQKQSVRSAGTVPLAVAVSGGNQILTSTVNADLNTSGGIGGVTDLAVGDRVLLNDIGAELTNFDLGIYVVTQVGSASLPHILTRADDASSIAELRSAYTFVEGGTSANSGWVQVTEGGTLGTASFSWVQFSNAGTFTAGNGITLNGNAFNFFANSYTSGDLWYANGTSTLARIPIGAGNRFMVSSGTAPQWSGYSMPGSVATSQILYASSGSQISALATANSGVLVTNGSGVPSISTALPNGVTYNGSTIYRAGGTDVPLTDGGTNASLTAVNGGLVYSTASALAITSAGTSGQFVRSGGAGAPTFFDLFGSGNTFTALQNFSGGWVITNTASTSLVSCQVPGTNNTSNRSAYVEYVTQSKTSGGVNQSGNWATYADTLDIAANTTTWRVISGHGGPATGWGSLVLKGSTVGGYDSSELNFYGRWLRVGNSSTVASIDFTGAASGSATIVMPSTSGTLALDTTNPSAGSIGLARKFGQIVVGDGTNNYIVVTHGLGTRLVDIFVRLSVSGDTGQREQVYSRTDIVDTNTVRIYFNTVQTPSDYYAVTVIG